MPANIDYQVVVRGFNNAAGGDFSPGAIIAIVDNPTNLAWTEYVNEVGEAFWTLAQKDPKVALLLTTEALLNYRPHVQIYRNEELVWAGWLGEVDENDTDIIFYAYSYLSGFYDLLEHYNAKWTGQTVATIVEAAFDQAQALTDSRVAWFTQGTIENPVTTSGGATGIIVPLYRAPYKRILSVFREMAALSISDTTNHVIFEVTPAGVFNFWKNRKATVQDTRSSYGGGMVRSFRRIRRPVQRRNQLYAVGTSPTSVNLNVTATDTTERDTWGLSQEPLYFSFVKDAQELTRVTNLRLKRAVRTDTDLYLSYHKNATIPYPATSYTYRPGDVVAVDINHGATRISESKVIMGQQVVYARAAENVRYLLGDTL